MGDRALVVLTDGRKFSPVLYTHFHGGRVGQIIEAALPRMRLGDLPYSFARLAGVFHESISGNHGLGCWNSPVPSADTLAAEPPDFDERDDGSAEWRTRRDERRQKVKEWREKVYADVAAQIQDKEYSHGDAGVFILDIRDWKATAYNGYGFESDAEGDDDAENEPNPILVRQFDGSVVTD